MYFCADYASKETLFQLFNFGKSRFPPKTVLKHCPLKRGIAFVARTSKAHSDKTRFGITSFGYFIYKRILTGWFYIHTYQHTYILTNIHTYLPTYINLLLHTYLHAYVLTYMHTYLNAYLPTCILTYMHTYLHAYLHTCILTYIHTTYIPTYFFLHSTYSSSFYIPTLALHCILGMVSDNT